MSANMADTASRIRVIDDDARPDSRFTRSQERSPRFADVYRLRIATVCLALTVLAFIQDPGRVAADTKLDLNVNPGGLMARAMHLWDPTGFSGQLQNQAYGYLWPMGPFYWLGHTIGLPGWVVQRLWWALLLCLAFLGIVKLAGLLGIRSPLARCIGAVAFALSPMVLAKLGTISSEVLPIALAPWILIPLVCGTQRGSPRRWAALSGVAVLCVGGVNAVATVAVLPIGFWWIATRTGGPRRRALGGWWLGAVALATVWWLVPLFVLGRYSPPFLDWIESAAITTRPTGAAAATRGASDWIAYVTEQSGPVWGAGWALATSAGLIIATGFVAAIGLAGLSRRDVPARGFLIGTLLTGFALVSLGHVGSMSGLFSQDLQTLLDGVLAPLRNVHKFDVLIRLPMAIGLIWCVDRILGAMPTIRDRARAIGLRAIVAAICCGIAVSALPALTGQLTRDRSFAEIPDYWVRTSSWLQNNGDGGRALVLPGASFAQYLWGRTQDDPLQALGNSWDVRDAVPLSNAGHTRLLDAVNERIDNGVGGVGLAQALNRSGFRWLVIRNDIDTANVGAPLQSVVHQALTRTPGIYKAQSFGPSHSPTTADDGIEIPDGNYPPVEVYGITDTAQSPIVLRDASRPIELVGATEGLLALSDAGVDSHRTVIVSGDAANSASTFARTQLIATDSGRLREINLGSSRDNASPALTQLDSFQLNRPVHDYLVPGVSPSAVAEFEGVAGVSASSSGSDLDALWARDPAHQPFAALDGDLETSWNTGELASGIGQSWTVRFVEPKVVRELSIAFVAGGQAAKPRSIAVTTDAGTSRVAIAPGNDRQRIEIPASRTGFLTLKLDSVQPDAPDTGFGIREVDIPGVTPSKPIRIQSSQPTDGAVLAAAQGRRSGCVVVAGTFRCVQGMQRYGEEHAGIDRWVWVKPGNYDLSATVAPRAGPDLVNAFSLPQGVRVKASSKFDDSSASSSASAMDGRRSTTWIASADDRRPTLDVSLPKPMNIDGMRITTTKKLAVSQPLQVEVNAGGQRHTGFLDRQGRLQMPPVLTDRLFITFQQVDPRRQVNSIGVSEQLPIGVTEVSLSGDIDPRKSVPVAGPVDVGCESGAPIMIDGKQVASMAGSFTSAQALGEASAPATMCGKSSVTLSGGWHRIAARSSDALLANSLSLLPGGSMSAATSTVGQSSVQKWESNSRAVSVTAVDHAQTLETNEAFNAGWRASMNGQVLSSVQVDGWRQAWVIPAGMAGTVSMTFAPDTSYRFGLLVGLLAALLLLGLALFRPRNSIPAPVFDAPVRWPVIGAGLVAILFAFGGWGLLAAATSGAVTFLIRRRRTAIVMVGVVGLCLVATVLSAAWAWPAMLTQPGWVESAEVLAVCGALGLVLGLFENAMQGRSIATHDNHASGKVSAIVAKNNK